MRKTRSIHPGKRRTTVSLPADSLRQATEIARSRGVSLGAVIAEAVAYGLKRQAAMERSAQIVRAYQRAFAGFADAELAILDGVMLEPAEG